MATAKDVATAIQSALDEIGVTGTLTVTKDRQDVARSLGENSGNDVSVAVDVHDLRRAT